MSSSLSARLREAARASLLDPSHTVCVPVPCIMEAVCLLADLDARQTVKWSGNDRIARCSGSGWQLLLVVRQPIEETKLAARLIRLGHQQRTAVSSSSLLV